MKKIVKWAAIILGVSAAVSAGLGLYISSRKAACSGGQGAAAADACSFIAGWQTGRSRAEALFRLSQLHAEEKLWGEEILDLEKIVAMGDSAALPREKMAEVYSALVKASGRKEDPAAVLKYSELAVQSGSADADIYISLAGAYIEAKKYTEALAVLDKAGALPNARKHPYYNTMAAAYGGMEQYDKAYEALKTGLTVPAPRPVLGATSKHMGMVCFELKRYKEAETYLSYALRAGAECPECGLLLTTIRESLEPESAPAARRKKKRN